MRATVAFALELARAGGRAEPCGVVLSDPEEIWLLSNAASAAERTFAFEPKEIVPLLSARALLAIVHAHRHGAGLPSPADRALALRWPSVPLGIGGAGSALRWYRGSAGRIEEIATPPFAMRALPVRLPEPTAVIQSATP